DAVARGSMGYTLELEYQDLRCRSWDDAQKATAIINSDAWIHPYHMQVTPATRLHPGFTACLEVEHFQGDHWNDDEATRVWLTLAPHMADGATIEFQGEGLERWRI